MPFSCWNFGKKESKSQIAKTQTVESEFSTPRGNVVIIDCGSSSCKVGFAGEKYPRTSTPTVVGRPKSGAAVGFRSERDTYVGAEAQQKRAVLNLRSPIIRGSITDWDDIEVCFEYIFNEELQINPSLFNVLVTDVLNNPSTNREKMIQLMFEKYNFKSFYLSPVPPLALFAYGYLTGVALDSGEGQTHIAPVYEGQTLTRSSRYIPLGGKDINRVLEYLLTASGKATEFFQTPGDREFLRRIKEELCYVAYDYQTEFALSEGKSEIFRLPDGTRIELDNELFRCTEALFEPLVIGVRTGGIHENIYRAIQLSDPYLTPMLYDHIVLSGGNTLFPGLKERLYREMRMMSEPDSKIRVHARAGRENAVFLGASLLGSLSKFQKLMIKYSEYAESGPAIVHRRCF